MGDLEEQVKTVQVSGKSISSILRDQRERYLDPLEETAYKVVACIPAYREEKNIASVVLRTMKQVDIVIVCDDGSGDMTAEIAESLGAYVVKHEVNMGKGAALRTAFHEALKHDPLYIVALDADGQHQPEEIPSLLRPLRLGEADMVIGSRYLNGENEVPLYRKLGLGVIDRFFKRHINEAVSDSQSGFRAFSRDAFNYIVNIKGDGYGVETEALKIATQNGLRIGEVPVNIRYSDLENTSKMNPFSHGAEILSTILNLVITERPLMMVGVPGIASLLVGVISLSMFIFYFNRTGYISLPFAILSTATMILGALFILVALILYAINKINRETRRHPLENI